MNRHEHLGIWCNTILRLGTLRVEIHCCNEVARIRSVSSFLGGLFADPEPGFRGNNSLGCTVWGRLTELNYREGKCPEKCLRTPHSPAQGPQYFILLARRLFLVPNPARSSERRQSLSYTKSCIAGMIRRQPTKPFCWCTQLRAFRITDGQGLDLQAWHGPRQRIVSFVMSRALSLFGGVTLEIHGDIASEIR